MQSPHVSPSPPPPPSHEEPLHQLALCLRGIAMAERPAVLWAEMSPLDLEDEDASPAEEQHGPSH